MADPNPCSSSSPPSPGFTLDSDEISSLLLTLLQSSSLPSSSPQHTPEEVRNQFFRSAPFPDPAGGFDSSSGLNFASESAFSGAIGSSAEVIGVGDCDSESERDQVMRDPEASRNSSKRGRVAEFHNLSEKKRRQKINEKMKALQKLIPNSNKTDKASMLDDAIDYLKQLQLQVQMLAMRNGSSLHPFYMTGMHSTQPTPAGIFYSEEEGLPCSSRGVRALYANQEISMRNFYNPADPDQKTFMPLATETGKSDHPFSLDPSTSGHCKPFNLTMSSKELCGDSKLPQLHLTSNRYGDESSSGVSS